MKKITYFKNSFYKGHSCIFCLALVLISINSYSAPFTKGNIVVTRVGDGTTALSTVAAPTFLDEYTVSGTLVQSIALPTTVNGNNKRLVNAGSSTSECFLNLSVDKRYLLLGGYDAAVATAALPGTTSVATNRVVGRIDVNGNVDTSTALSDFASGGNIRSVISTNGTDFWANSSNTGISYTTFGATTSTSLTTTTTNVRVSGIFFGQLYYTTASGTIRLAALGSGLPTTSGQTGTNLTGFPTSGGSPYGFIMFDLDPNTAGVDVIYIADDSSTFGGIIKYSLVSGTWVKAANVVTATPVRGITGAVNNGVVTFYANTSTSTIITVTDNSGYNGNPTTVATPTVIVPTAATNTAYRGVAFAPETPVATGLNAVQSQFNVTASNGTVSFTSEAGRTLEIYNSVGQRIISTKTVEGLNSIAVAAKGVVLVKVANRLAKVVL